MNAPLRIVSVVFVLLVAACGGGSFECNATTCTGCCTASGVCEGKGSPSCGPATGVDAGCTATTTCQQAGATCGTIPDGCGRQLDCGQCLEGQTCGGAGVANVCAVGSCSAKSCAALGKDCGQVSDGCAKTLDCGRCATGLTCGAGGHLNVCGSGTCVPKTCAGEHAACGVLMDGCGATLSCGPCADGQTCGGGGMANVCAPICPASCPTGYSCDATGACAGGDQSHLVFDVIDPATVTVAGTITLNAAVPATQYCGDGVRALVTFTNLTTPASSSSTFVEDCTVVTEPYAWSLALRPGAYLVSVEGRNDSSLPNWSVDVLSSLVVTGPVSNVRLDVSDPTQVSISGSVTMNGALPPTEYCGGGVRAQVTFTHQTNAHFSSATYVEDCSKLNDPYAWALTLRPGTYSVSVQGRNGSDLPNWSVEVNPAFTVTSSATKVVFNVTDPAKVSVSGLVTLNGAIPPTQYCGSGVRALVAFTHLTNPHFSSATFVDDCTKLSDPYAWALSLRPGTYSVSVQGRNDSDLPNWPVDVNTNFVVSAAASNVIFNVTDPATVSVSGLVTMNGAVPPTTSCGSGVRAVIAFTNAANAHFSSSVFVDDCARPSDPYAWSIDLRPGTYQVTVQGRNESGLPNWAVEVNAALVVNTAAANVVLNVVDPAQVSVGGTVTLNGGLPSTEFCGDGVRAEVTFTHSTNPLYSSSVFVEDCARVSDPYAWQLSLRPGTYSVSVQGRNDSALPNWSVEVNANLVVTGAATNVQLNVTDPAKVTVSGVVTMNGAVPVTEYCGTGVRALIVFTNLANSHFNAQVFVDDCTKRTDPYVWSIDLRPGTYNVTVQGRNDSDLPNWAVTVATRLRVR